MKIIVPAFLALAISISTPLAANQIAVVHLSHTTVTDDEMSIEFELNGAELRYMYFGDSGLYFGAGVAGAAGDDEICIDDFCIDLEVDLGATFFDLGYNFDNPFTPFISASRTNSQTDFGITGIGFIDTTETETNYGFGTWVGGESRRLQLAFQGVDTDDPAVSLGGYTVLSSSVVLSSFYATTIENSGDSWSLLFGLGWSF